MQAATFYLFHCFFLVVISRDVTKLPIFWVVATASGFLGLAISFTKLPMFWVFTVFQYYMLLLDYSDSICNDLVKTLDTSTLTLLFCSIFCLNTCYQN
jgi:hypothetical protein